MVTSKADIIAQLRRDLLPLQGFKPVSGTNENVGLGQINYSFLNASFPVGAMHEFISSDKNDNTEITLSDSKGQILFKSTVMVVNGINNYHLSNLNLAPGIYYFQISNDNFVSKNIKHIIQ